MKWQVRRGSDQLDLDAISTQRPTSEVHRLQNVTAEAQEIRAAAVARPIKVHGNDLLNFARGLGHDDDAVAHIDRFVDVMGHEEHRGTACVPEAQHFILHAHAGEGIKGAERFVEQEDSWMIDERAGQCDPLSHAAGKMVRKGVGKCFQAHETHEFVNFRAFFTEHTARDQAGLDVASDGEPREEIRVLKNQTTFCAGARNPLGADRDFARARKDETGNEAEKGGFAATAGTHNRYELPCCHGERDIIQGSNADAVSRWEMLAYMSHPQRRGLAGGRIIGDGYHLMTPFCQTSTRSRTLKSTVMMLEKNPAIITRAA